MRKLITILLLLFTAFCGKSQGTLSAGVQNASKLYLTSGTSTDGDRVYIYLPWDYYSSGKKYPVIFFFPGGGERNDGDNLSVLNGHGISHLTSTGNPPYSVNSNGDTTRFICTTYGPSSIEEGNLRHWMHTLEVYNLRIDTSRIYFTGLSRGGSEIEKLINVSLDSIRAAGSVLMSAGGSIGAGWYTPTIAEYKDFPMWFLVGDNDNEVTNHPQTAYSSLTSEYPAGPYKLTVYSGGHSGWDIYYNPTWVETSLTTNSPSTSGLSIYDWMLNYTVEDRGTPASPVNIKPTSDAGADQNLSSGITYTILDGRSSDDVDGVITDYRWTTTSAATIMHPNSDTTTVTGLSDGNFYKFYLEVTDDSLTTGLDSVMIRVGLNAGGPVVVFDEDTTTQENTYIFNSISVTPSGSATFSPSTNNVVWSLDSKPSGAGAYWGGSPYQLNGHKLNNLNKDGYYVISLRITQSDNKSTTKTITITKGSPPSNQNPTAHAGSDQTLNSGITNTTLNGSGDDVDGVITDYKWTTTSAATITNSDNAITTVTGLNDGNSYNFKLTVTDNDNATGSDNVTITVNTSSMPPDTPSYQIPLDQSAKFWKGDTIFYQFVDVNGGGIAQTLIDEQNSSAPSTLYWTNYNSQIGYPQPLVLDLGGLYKITAVSFYSKNNYGYIDVMTGNPLAFKDSTEYRPSGTGWVDYNTSVYTRYVKVQWNVNKGGSRVINEMRLYGHIVGDSLSRTAPSMTVHTPDFTVGNFMGTNIWGGLAYNIQDNTGGIFREYVPLHYIDTATHEHRIDSIKFVFSKFSKNIGGTKKYYLPDSSTSFNWTSPGTLQGDLRHYKLNNKELFFSLKESPEYAQGYSYGYAIDKTNHPTRDSVDAKQYDRLSRLSWTMAAMFGSQSHPADSVQSSFPKADSAGMDVMKYIESGNEMNATWDHPYGYYSPEMYEAYQSSFYDGDANTMGSRMGIKNADPNMKVIMAGTAGVHPDRLKSFYYFSYNKRKDHKLPVDVINFHAYPAYGNHTSPEQRRPQEQFKDMIQTSREVCPSCEVWLTEWGFARNMKSVNSVAGVPGKDSAEVQADWVARYWLLLTFAGLDRSTYYQIRNEPSIMGRYDNGLVGTYQSMGLTYQELSDDFQSYYVYAFPAWYFVNTLDLKLGHYKPADSLRSGLDSIYVYKYQNPDNDSVCYAVWSGTVTDRVTDSFSIKTGNPSTTVSVTNLKDKYVTGNTSTLTTDDNGEIPLVITETPQLIFTTQGTGGGQLIKKGIAPQASTVTYWKTIYKNTHVYILFRDDHNKVYSMKLNQ